VSVSFQWTKTFFTFFHFRFWKTRKYTISSYCLNYCWFSAFQYFWHFLDFDIFRGRKKSWVSLWHLSHFIGLQKNKIGLSYRCSASKKSAVPKRSTLIHFYLLLQKCENSQSNCLNNPLCCWWNKGLPCLKNNLFVAKLMKLNFIFFFFPFSTKNDVNVVRQSWDALGNRKKNWLRTKT
jgi:hypothetical protein